jgi:hypothetical protein
MSLQIRRPAFTARSVTLGTLFNIVFGTLWVGNGLLALKTMQTLFLFAALAAVSITFLVVSFRLFRSVRRFPLQMPANEFQRKNRALNCALIIELVGSTVLSILLVLFGRSELVLPVIVLSVGLYLLAPALILGLVQYFVAGALLCILPIGTVVLATPGNSWLIIVGFIGGSIQFGLASINLRSAVSLRHRLSAERTLAVATHGVGDAAESSTTLHHSGQSV